MNEETKEALEKSILKWERIVDGVGSDNSSTDCALCLIYNPGDDCEDDDCQDCPVEIATGLIYCLDSPYTDWHSHHDDSHINDGDDPLKIECPACKDLAQKELDFLKSLRET